MYCLFSKFKMDFDSFTIFTQNDWIVSLNSNVIVSLLVDNNIVN